MIISIVVIFVVLYFGNVMMVVYDCLCILVGFAVSPTFKEWRASYLFGWVSAKYVVFPRLGGIGN